MQDALRERLNAPGPKRILSLDGGGIRALITLRFLARLEALLRTRTGRRDLVLADYFDLIGGTSTGSIIAVCLSLGFDVESIRGMYRELGSAVFRRRMPWLGPVTGIIGAIVGSMFDEQPLERHLRARIGDRTLGSEDLRTGLVIAAKRVDTGSSWDLVNLPDHKFAAENRDIPLWKAVRASTAAPPVFKPIWMDGVDPPHTAGFVDGGMTQHLNPSMQLLMAATLRGYGLEWPTGPDALLLCSVGSGSFVSVVKHDGLLRHFPLPVAGILLAQSMNDASEFNQMLLQWMSESPTARRIDERLGTLSGQLLAGRPLLTYVRYNLQLDHDELRAHGFDLTDAQLAAVRRMDKADNLDLLEAIGTAAAERQVEDAHLPAAFDVAPTASEG